MFVSLHLARIEGSESCLQTNGPGYLEMMLTETKLTPGRVTILTPSEPRWRGCQLSLRFDCAVDAVEHAMRRCVDLRRHLLRWQAIDISDLLGV